MQFTIRPVQPGDGKGINALRRMPGVFENILGIPSERVQFSEEFVQSTNRSSHQFVAVTEDEAGGERIIGTAGLSVYDNPRTRHTGGVGVMVHAGHQHQGVGTRLMEALLDIADNWLMLVRVELTVFVDNAGAITLYEKLGFVIEGTKRAAAIRGGRYMDEYMMARIRHLPDAKGE
ncbi:MAG: GNAT family N-acetyltransferase [Clostridia bacterium]|nr:GNAT family N-acetyltransferase [Clostridia bacterium]